MEQFNPEGKIAGYNRKTIVIVLVAVIALGIGFYVGAKYEKSKLARLGLLKNNSNGGAAVAQKTKKKKTKAKTNQVSGNVISGSIVSKNAQSVTIKTNGNVSQIVSVTSATKIGATETGTLADLTVGEQITVSGTKNPDGSFTATNIQPVAPTAVVK